MEASRSGTTEDGLVGRADELATLVRALDAATAGSGSVVVLAGEPGIGKTTLAGALAARARAQGVRAVWGRAWDSGGAPAYWAWRQVVRTLAEDFDDGELRAAAGPGARWLVSIAPELDERLPGADPVAPAEAEQARFALFDALAAFLRASASRGPLVVLFDDLHAADVATLRALDFVAHLARELPLLVVAALQPGPLAKRPDAEQLVERLHQRGERLDLGGLAAEDLGALLGVGAGVAREVHLRSAGNPLFAEELARVMPQGGGLDRLPGSIQTMLRERLEELGRDGMRALTAAAVIGHEFRLVTTERVAGLERAQLLDLLDAAERAGIVQPVDVTGRYRFSHGLMRETLYAGLRRGERAQQHLRVGEVLRELDPEQHLSELAHHFVEAASLGDAGPAVEFSRRAGQRAMRVLAFEQAADHFAAALRAIELGEPDAAARGRLLLELGVAQGKAADAASETTLTEAATLARALGDPELLADVALAVGPYALSAGTVDERWVGLLEEALRALGEADPARRARLSAELGRALYFAPGEGARRLELAGRSLALAREHAGPQALAAVLSDAHVATWGPDRIHENLALIAELQELLEELGDPRAGLPSLVRSIDMQLELGDVVAAGIALERLETRAAELRDLRAGVLAVLHRSRQAILEGRFENVPGLLAEAARRDGTLRNSPVPIMIGAQSFLVRMLCGGLEEFEPVARQTAERLPLMPSWRAALARILVEQGRIAEARHELDRLAVAEFGRLERDQNVLLTLGVLAEVAWRTGATEHAASLTALLAPFEDRMMATPGGLFLGPLRRPLGQLAALAGDPERALALLEAARVQARRIGAAPSQVLADVDAGAVRLATGDFAGAREVLERGKAAAEALGMAPSVTRADWLLGEVVSAELVAQATAAVAPASPRSAATVGRFVREGDTWVLALGARSVRVRDAKGLQYLAVLLAHPGVEVHALDLVGGGAVVAGASGDGLSVRADVGGSGPQLDAEAKAAYRERIADLRETIEEATRFHDPERVVAAQEELDLVAQQLAGAVGLGGRDRTTGSAAERARVNVTRALRGALKRIAEQDAALGRDIESGVRTGTLCSYSPPALHPVAWEVGGA